MKVKETGAAAKSAYRDYLKYPHEVVFMLMQPNSILFAHVADCFASLPSVHAKQLMHLHKWAIRILLLHYINGRDGIGLSLDDIKKAIPHVNRFTRYYLFKSGLLTETAIKGRFIISQYGVLFVNAVFTELSKVSKSQLNAKKPRLSPPVLPTKKRLRLLDNNINF